VQWETTDVYGGPGKGRMKDGVEREKGKWALAAPLV